MTSGKELSLSVLGLFSSHKWDEIRPVARVVYVCEVAEGWPGGMLEKRSFFASRGGSVG